MRGFIRRHSILAIGAWGLAALQARAASPSAFAARWWKINSSKSIPYRLFIPKNMAPGRQYPVMLALHGAGERGTDNVSQLNNGFTNFWVDDSIQKDNPCFVVAPQCPLNEQWVSGPPPWDNYDFAKTPITDDLQAVIDILDSLEKEFPIDKDREYVSGMSMGGAGTWYTLMQCPTRFAAAVPVCGASDPGQAKVLDQINIWTFHEVDDPTINVRNTQATVAAIRAIGGSRLKYTEYPASMGYGHESWKPAGKDPEMHRWVFSKSLAPATAIPPWQPQTIALGHAGSAADALGRMVGQSAGRTGASLKQGKNPTPVFGAKARGPGSDRLDAAGSPPSAGYKIGG